MPVFKAMDGEKEAVPLKESCGRICGEFAYIYPPGIPLLAPGEQITEEILETLQDYIEKICRSRDWKIQTLSPYR